MVGVKQDGPQTRLFGPLQVGGYRIANVNGLGSFYPQPLQGVFKNAPIGFGKTHQPRGRDVVKVFKQTGSLEDARQQHIPIGDNPQAVTGLLQVLQHLGCPRHQRPDPGVTPVLGQVTADFGGVFGQPDPLEQGVMKVAPQGKGFFMAAGLHVIGIVDLISLHHGLTQVAKVGSSGKAALFQQWPQPMFGMAQDQGIAHVKEDSTNHASILTARLIKSMVERYQTPEMKALWSEASKYHSWALVELHALQAWEELGQVPAGTAQVLQEALKHNLCDDRFAQLVDQLEQQTRHDMVAFTRAITQRLDDPGLARWLHLGLTSTDVVDTAQNWRLVQATQLIHRELQQVQQTLAELATRYKYLPSVGRTHGVHAEPTSFGLRFLGFWAALQRDGERLEQAQQAVGVAMISGSVGNYAHVPPAIEASVAQALGLSIEPLSTQVVPRDRHAQLMGALAILGSNIERIAVELRHLQRTEVREVQEGFSYQQTGSSSMPHKKNPITAENLSGLARLLRSNLQAALENIPLWHERDISHSSAERLLFPDTTTLAHYLLRRLNRLLKGLSVNEARVAHNLEATHGVLYSQRVLGLLIEAGLERTAAYQLVQQHALTAWETGQSFRSLLASDPANPLSPEQLDRAFDPGFFLRHIDQIYQRFGL